MEIQEVIFPSLSDIIIQVLLRLCWEERALARGV